jgi:hypothetical protein
LYFTYTLLDANDKKIRTKKVTKSTISSMNDYLQIPKTVTSGTYKLKVSVEYKGDIPAEAYFEFTIQKEITETTPVDEKTSTEETTSEPETTPEQIEETKQEVIETQRKVTIKDPLEPGTYLARSYLTTEEKNQLETYISTEGIDYALFKCRQITFPALELECKYYSIIANNEQSFCSILDEGIRRDKCYLAFAKVSTDLEICKEIEEASVVSACKMHILNNKNKLLLENNNQGDFYKTFNEVYGDGTLNATGLTQQETE